MGQLILAGLNVLLLHPVPPRDCAVDLKRADIFSMARKTHWRYSPTAFAALLAVTGSYEALYGLIITRSSLGISGHFGNQVGFATFLVALLPFALSFVRYRKKLFVAFGIIASITIFVAIVLSCSRAGLLAAFIVIITSFWPRLRLVWQRLSRPARTVVIYGTGVLCLAGAVLLYLHKKDSADGRLLIWRNTAAMIADKPLFGHGPDGFRAKYMLYQADYFRTHPDSRFAPLADNVRAPFNEYLGIAAEYGIVGLLLLGGLTVFVLRGKLRRAGPFGRTAAVSLLAVGIVALFSYPFHYPAVLFVMAVDFVLIAGSGTDWKAWGARTIALCIVLAAIHSITDKNEQRQFQRLFYSLENDASRIRAFEHMDNRKISKSLQYLSGYGSALNRVKAYAHSAEILKRYFKYRADADIAVIQTDNYYQLGEYSKAEYWADLAANMCPNRFIPLYYKVMILSKTGRQSEAIALARRVLNKPIKIHAVDVYKVRLKLQRFLEE